MVKSAVFYLFCQLYGYGVAAVALAEEEVFRSYASDFSQGTDGWYARSAGEASISVADGALTITGRTGGPTGASWWDNYVLPPASVDYEPVPHYVEPAESPVTDTDYPYVLTQGRVPMYHHGTLRNIPYLREIYPVPLTWINPITAREIGVEDGDWVKLTSGFTFAEFFRETEDPDVYTLEQLTEAGADMDLYEVF